MLGQRAKKNSSKIRVGELDSKITAASPPKRHRKDPHRIYPPLLASDPGKSSKALSASTQWKVFFHRDELRITFGEIKLYRC